MLAEIMCKVRRIRRVVERLLLCIMTDPVLARSGLVMLDFVFAQVWLCMQIFSVFHTIVYRRCGIRQLNSMALTNVAREEAELKIENVCMQAIALEAQLYLFRQCLHSGMAFAFCVLLTVGLLFYSAGVSF